MLNDGISNLSLDVCDGEVIISQKQKIIFNGNLIKSCNNNCCGGQCIIPDDCYNKSHIITNDSTLITDNCDVISLKKKVIFNGTLLKPRMNTDDPMKSSICYESDNCSKTVERKYTIVQLLEKYKGCKNYNNYKKFLDKVNEKQGNKFDYSKIKPTDIESNIKKSIITVVCNNCGEEQTTKAEYHFNLKACKKCKHKGFEIILPEIEKIISDEELIILYNVSKEYQNHKDFRKYLKFLRYCYERKSNSFNYSKTTPDDINNDTEISDIIIICNKCGEEEEIRAKNHFRNEGCKKCKKDNPPPRKNRFANIDNIIINESEIPEEYKKHPNYCRYLEFLKRAISIHGDGFNYLNTSPADICGRIKDSEIIVACNNCGEEQTTTAYNHYRVKCCKICKGKVGYQPEIIENIITDNGIFCGICKKKYNADVKINDKGCILCQVSWPLTYGQYIDIAKYIHGDQYEYSNDEITDKINSHTKICTKCKDCKFTWNHNASYHLRSSGECGNCQRWTYEKFLADAVKFHGLLYEYSCETKCEFGSKTNIDVRCKLCACEWNTCVEYHINNGVGCPRCSNNERWFKNLEKFSIMTFKIHGDKYDYSDVKEEDLINNQSIIHVTCKLCKYDWKPTIKNHIKGSGCLRCAGVEIWKHNIEKFSAMTAKIHGNKYNYDNVHKEDLVNCSSHLHIKCKNCSCEWFPTINDHINNKTSCPRCSGNESWKCNIVKFMYMALIIHGDNYDYINVKEEHLFNVHSIVNIICKRCKREFSQKISDHINGGCGCPYCRSSKGEQRTADYLTQIEINFKPQFILGSISNRRFDFGFYRDDILILIEYDGIQHFYYNDFHHEDYNDFLEHQKVDITKTKAAIEAGKIIRIDYTQINNISYHIEKAFELFKLGENCYFSNEELYNYIINELEI